MRERIFLRKMRKAIAKKIGKICKKNYNAIVKLDTSNNVVTFKIDDYRIEYPCKTFDEAVQFTETLMKFYENERS